MTELVAVDIGGTHARFAIARADAGRVLSVGDPVTLRTADFTSLQTAWQAFAAIAGPLPRAASIAVAGPTTDEVIRLTNHPWTIRPALLATELALDNWLLINDFEAVAHGVAQASPADFVHLCGPDTPLPTRGVITVIGPGTGLGVAQLWCGNDTSHVVPTEGGHIDFAPLDAIEDAILARLRRRYRRVSVERVVSGPGLATIREALAELEGRTVTPLDDHSLWQLGLSGEDELAAAAVERFCLSLGSVAGDLALAHGACAVVIAGGLGQRVRDHLLQSGFAGRFCSKGRFETRLAGLPVKLIVRAQPGLLGAAAAFAKRQVDGGAARFPVL